MKQEKYICIGGPKAGEYIFFDCPYFRTCGFKYAAENGPVYEESMYYLEEFVCSDRSIFVWRHQTIESTFQLMHMLLHSYSKMESLESLERND